MTNGEPNQIEGRTAVHKPSDPITETHRREKIRGEPSGAENTPGDGGKKGIRASVAEVGDLA